MAWWKQDIELYRFEKDNTFYCHLCGHSEFIPVIEPKKICSWCGNLIYRTDKIGQLQCFKDKLKSEMLYKKRIEYEKRKEEERNAIKNR